MQSEWPPMDVGRQGNYIWPQGRRGADHGGPGGHLPAGAVHIFAQRVAPSSPGSPPQTGEWDWGTQTDSSVDEAGRRRRGAAQSLRERQEGANGPGFLRFCCTLGWQVPRSCEASEGSSCSMLSENSLRAQAYPHLLISKTYCSRWALVPSKYG